MTKKKREKRKAETPERYDWRGNKTQKKKWRNVRYREVIVRIKVEKEGQTSLQNLLAFNKREIKLIKFIKENDGGETRYNVFLIKV